MEKIGTCVLVGVSFLAMGFLGYIVGSSRAGCTAAIFEEPVTKAAPVVKTNATEPAPSPPTTSPYAISGANLLTDLDKWADKKVYLTNVRVHGANNYGAIAQASGVIFKITTSGIDKETFRTLLKDCSSNPCEGLNLTVTPTGRKVVSGWPELINVRIGR
jgi:hypothetical protein